MDGRCRCHITAVCNSKMEKAQREAAYYRRLAARGETVPEF
jgi:hypothetical protein